MDNFVQLITNGATEFTPSMLVSLFGFVLLFDMIGTVIAASFKTAR